MEEHQYGRFDSWEIISDDVARKTCDKSFFKYRGSGIPQGIRWYFGAEYIKAGEQIDIVLVYFNSEYKARIQKTDSGADRTRIFWSGELAKKFAPYELDEKQYVLEFHRVIDCRYEVSFIDRTGMEDRDIYNIQAIVSFLDKYSGKKYIAPEIAGDQAEFMSQLESLGIYVRDMFVDLVEDASINVPEIEKVSCSNWINQEQVITDHFGIELKKKEWKEYPNSLTVSIEKCGVIPGEGYCISIRSDTNSVKSSKTDLERQLRLLDCDLIEGMAYLAQHKKGDYHYHGTDRETVRELCKDGTIQKLEIIKIVNEPVQRAKADTILADVTKAVEEILPFYEYVMQNEEWWPSLSEYDPGLTADQYYNLFLDEEVTKKEWLEALIDLLGMPGHLATCADLQAKYQKSHARYNRYLTSLARRIMEKTGCKGPEDKDDSTYWPVLFQGKNVAGDDSYKGNYCWKMREPVVEAVERIIDKTISEEADDMGEVNIHNNHNLILYGPPGTGKTYNSVNYAVAICDGRKVEEVMKESYQDVLVRYRELQDAGRIAFTTFHQSYGYEEFIEGIKPKLDVESETLGYIIENGVFKELCKQAKNVSIHPKEDLNIKEHPHIWGMLLGGVGPTELKQYCFENDVIRFGWESVDDTEAADYYTEEIRGIKLAKHQVYDFIYSMEIGDIVLIAKSTTSIDAVGVITGEYEHDDSKEKYQRTRKVKWLVKNVDFDMLPYLPNGRKQLSTFYLYPFDYIGMDVVSQILNKYNTSEIDVEQETKPYVFIIDEINRGNISKIFGELITLIEDTKRSGTPGAMEAILPYSKETFSVPKNVYILGTMNTADRSIALMDTALRRRFEFVEMMPNSEVLESLGVGTIEVDDDELDVAKMMDVINERIEYLYDREHTIGHAFFTKLADTLSIETLAGIFQNKVIPLLQEYFYEDYEKIQLVLGDNDKDDEFKFILDKPVKVKKVFKGNPDIDLPEKGYSIQHEAFFKLESYKQIFEEK